MNHISGNDILRGYFDHLPIAKDSGLECEILFQAVDNVTGVVFLSKSDDGVEEKKCTDDTEINPVL